MGIFYDECEYCHNRVRKTARFCNHCGKPAPGGWWKCPNCNCGKWIGNDSQFCPHCNTPLYPENRPDLAGGVWQKAHTRFAERFEAGDVKRLLTSGLQIQEGTLAILLDAGKVSDILTAGRHDPDGVLRKINWFGDPPPRSFVLVDAGEVAVPVKVEALRTAEGFPLEFYGEVIVRFQGDREGAQRFVGNLMKERRTFEFSDVADKIQSLVRIAVADCCTTATVDDLVRDPERRNRLHTRMTSEIKTDFDACGLEIVRVSSAEFTGDEYEEYAEKNARVDLERRRIEREAALRALENGEELAKCKDASELLNRKREIDHEFRLEELEREFDEQTRRLNREREVTRLKQAWEEEDVRRQQRMKTEQAKHEIELKRLLDEYEQLKTVNDATAKAKATKIWLEVRKIKDEMASNQKALDAARRKGMTPEELIADIDDPIKREDLKEIFKMKLQSGMTEKQILATMGIVSTTDLFVEEMKRLYGDAADREDRKLSKVLEPAIEAAKRTPSGPNIIK